MVKCIQKTMDGNTAAAYVSYAFTEVAAIYPITPSSQMAELIDEWSSHGKKNIFGEPVRVEQMQSEGGAAGAIHGVLQAGALATTYTASQGLLLMIPNMYKIAGELLPGVFHVSARALAANALSIFGDHQDVMATRQTGFAILASSSVQEAMDLAAVAHLAAIKGRIPFLHFFDGFRTSHEIQKIDVLDYKDLAQLVDQDALREFRNRALNPDHPVARGTTQNPDIYFQTRESVNKFYNELPCIIDKYLQEINKLTGRNYQFFTYLGDPEAERIIVAMGSGCEAIEETVNYLNSKGEKVGLVKVHVYRPFLVDRFLASVPGSVRKIAVLDRTKEPGAAGDPLYLDVRNAFYSSTDRPIIVGGRYGLGSKDFTPAHIAVVFENLKQDTPKNQFTVSINDDVTFTSLPEYTPEIDPTPTDTKACKFWGLGADGTVGANKSAIKIIGDNTEMYVQGYFAYDSKKSGGLTVSHLRFGQQPIKSTYLITKADFIACHNQSYVHQYNLLDGLKPGGIFLLNCIWTQAELEERLPAAMKQYLAKNNINFYTVNAVKIAADLGLGGRINMIMQAAFFKLSQVIHKEEAASYLREFVADAYGKQGSHVVEKNYTAIEKGFEEITQVVVPMNWADAVQTEKNTEKEMPDFIKKMLIPMNRQEGDKIPVSNLIGSEDGSYPLGSTAWEKRRIAIRVPEWQVEQCIQCNHCSFVCPHSVIRPVLVTKAELSNASAQFLSKPAAGMGGLHFHMAISVEDCTGCGSCVDVCPAKTKALVMKPLSEQLLQAEASWNFIKGLPLRVLSEKEKRTVKGSQFLQPFIEFSGACAGCGETPYAKLVTQLFGDRMMIANAAGCSTVWGASAPAVSYTVNSRGHGPAWGFSLFEDNAEYGFGMYLGTEQIRQTLASAVEKAIREDISDTLKVCLQDWLDHKNEGTGTRERADSLIIAIESEKSTNGILQNIYHRRDFLVKRSHWIFGGDGWAYDIGFGGLDHVLASREDVNVLVFDTEVYSNTGGQSSKATPTAAIAQFAAGGKKVRKKDLGLMAISYGYVYVAQIAMGADKNQTIKVIAEAEAYPGPSLIIAYAPCVNHGISAGMGKSQAQAKRAVEAGYWSLYRYNPQLKALGKNPFQLDSKEPTASFQEFVRSEVRYSALLRQFPDSAQSKIEQAEIDAMERLAKYKQLAN
ncbi:MAG: pyruvate:ferredoxin (flavodoxin) oxidoreductase [Firmicutes bacterium HGW-Firmicutes-12]|nr:MAG: pyruvate:ferredoxin (flavodoxin) oxidoreductase [Firmicutes bacterium HGW-Firmicutes-12]